MTDSAEPMPGSHENRAARVVTVMSGKPLPERVKAQHVLAAMDGSHVGCDTCGHCEGWSLERCLVENGYDGILLTRLPYSPLLPAERILAARSADELVDDLFRDLSPRRCLGYEYDPRPNA